MNIPRKIINALGYDVLNIEKYHPTIESHLKILFRALDIDVVFDVGANNGGYGRLLRNIGYKGYILSFEPVRACYEQLENYAGRDPKWMTFNYALGMEEMESTINVPKSTDFASFLDVTQRAKDIWVEDFVTVDSEKVQVKRLDDVFESLLGGLNGGKKIFLKLDTQGFDLEVFRGAENTLKQLAGMQSEISILPIYEKMPNYIESLSCYREAGFEVTGFYPVSRNIETLVVVEFDCILIRNPKI